MEQWKGGAGAGVEAGRERYAIRDGWVFSDAYHVMAGGVGFGSFGAVAEDHVKLKGFVHTSRSVQHQVYAQNNDHGVRLVPGSNSIPRYCTQGGSKSPETVVHVILGMTSRLADRSS